MRHLHVIEGCRLNLRQAVELTGIISAHSPNLIEASKPISPDAVRRYAHFSQLRVNAWLTALGDLPREVMETPVRSRHFIWRRAEVMFVDVMAGGLIARVWGAVLTASDRSLRTCAAEKFARAILASQMRAQQAMLRMLVEGPHLTHERVVGLDRLRRRIERWTDLLLGHLVRRFALADFAYDLDRALDFGEEQLSESWGTRHHRVWDLYLLCLRSAFPDHRLPGGIEGEWREELFQSILGSFPAEVFLDDGMLKSIRLQRILHASSRREGPPAAARFASSRLGKLLARKPDESETGTKTPDR